MTTKMVAEEISAEQYFDAYLKFECSPHALKKMVDDGTPVQIIDMRTARAYEKGHVPGAVNIELKGLPEHLKSMDKGVPVVVYCYDTYCHVAARGALLLARHGFNVQKLLGGYDVLVEKYPAFPKSGSAGVCTDKETCS